MGTSGKSMAVSRLSGCLLLIGLVKLTSSEHSGFPTWLSNNLEEFENVAVSWDNASAVPAWLKGTFQERSCKARFWRKLEVRQHGGWVGKDIQVQRRCKWGPSEQQVFEDGHLPGL